MTENADHLGALLAAAKQELEALEEDLLWTEKAHFASAEVLARCNFWVGIASTVAASVAAATVLTEAAPAVTGVAALIAAIASGLLTFLKPKDAQERHLKAGRRMNALRVQIRQALRLDLSPALNPAPESLRNLAREFAQEKAQIDAEAPATSNRAFRAARKKIEAGHFQHASDTATAQSDTDGNTTMAV